jgi:hypothetical protein
LRPAVAGGFTLDDFTVDERVGTVTCPNQITRPITATRAVIFGMTWHVAAARCAPNAPRRLRLLTAAAPARHPAQDAVWARTDAHNKLRSLLREFYPAILAAFSAKRGGLLRPEARALLAAAPTPRAAARLTLSQLRSLLHRAGLQRGLDAEAARLQQVLRADFLHHPSLVEDAFGQQALALLRQLDTACGNATDLAAAATERFAQHLDAAIITSMPGLAALTGARVLAEIGDDRDRFADARGLKAYARSAPVTRASGKSTAVLHRRVKNQRWPRLDTSGRSPR